MLTSHPEDAFPLDDFGPSAPSEIAASGVAGVTRDAASGAPRGQQTLVEPAFDLALQPSRVPLLLKAATQVLETEEQRQVASGFVQLLNCTRTHPQWL